MQHQISLFCTFVLVVGATLQQPHALTLRTSVKGGVDVACSVVYAHVGSKVWVVVA